MTRSTRRGPWLPEEDGTLLQLVRSQGPNNWVRISQHMQHRSPKQCRERYHQNLKPTLNHEPISATEGELIEQLVVEMGKRWAEIARRLGNRSDNAVKNWWNGSMNRRKRNNVPPTTSHRVVGPRTQPIPATRHPLPDYHHQPSSSHETYTHQVYPPVPMIEHSRLTNSTFEHSRTSTYTPELQLPPHRTESNQPVLSHSVHTSRLPTSEPRSSNMFAQSTSAPGSLQATPNPFTLRPPQAHSESRANSLRPPVADSRATYQYDWHLPRITGLEPTMISPAGTDYSHAPSLQQAPSLVSDNQSHYSISPKTISSPRPGMPAPIDTSQEWMGMQRRNSFSSMPQSARPRHVDEGYVSAIPPSAISDAKQHHMPLESEFSRTSGYSSMRAHAHGPFSPEVPSPGGGRDTRMTLSSLVH